MDKSITFFIAQKGAPEVQLIKRWSTDLAVPGRALLKAKLYQP